MAKLVTRVQTNNKMKKQKTDFVFFSEWNFRNRSGAECLYVLPDASRIIHSLIIINYNNKINRIATIVETNESTYEATSRADVSQLGIQ